MKLKITNRGKGEIQTPLPNILIASVPSVILYQVGYFGRGGVKRQGQGINIGSSLRLLKPKS